jgi:hypothetical protein
VKKALLGALASLMLAGAISAVSGFTSNTAAVTMAVVSEGSAPLPFAAAPLIEPSDTPSLGK